MSPVSMQVSGRRFQRFGRRSRRRPGRGRPGVRRLVMISHRSSSSSTPTAVRPVALLQQGSSRNPRRARRQAHRVERAVDQTCRRGTGPNGRVAAGWTMLSQSTAPGRAWSRRDSAPKRMTVVLRLHQSRRSPSCPALVPDQRWCGWGTGGRLSEVWPAFQWQKTKGAGGTTAARAHCSNPSADPVRLCAAPLTALASPS